MLNTRWQAGHQLSFTASPEGVREKGKVSCVCMNETVITHTIYVLYCTVVSVIEQLTSHFPLFSCQVWTLIFQTVSVHTFLSSFTTPYLVFFFFLGGGALFYPVFNFTFYFTWHREGGEERQRRKTHAVFVKEKN